MLMKAARRSATWEAAKKTIGNQYAARAAEQTIMDPTLLLHHLCPILFGFKFYGFQFRADGINSDRWCHVRSPHSAGLLPLSCSTATRAFYRLLILGSLAYVAYYFYRYWRVSYSADNQTGICYTFVVIVILTTTVIAFMMTWALESEILVFIDAAIKLAEAQLTETEYVQFLAKARLYGRRLLWLTNAIIIMKLAEGFYQVVKQVRFVSEASTGFPAPRSAIIQDNLKQVIEVDHLDDPLVVAILSSIRVLLFNGLCEYFTLLFMALFAYCSYLVTFSLPHNMDNEDHRRQLSAGDPILSRCLQRMIIFQKQHANIVRLMKNTDSIFSPMLFIWMIFLMAGICFCVRGLKDNLTEARNFPVILLIIVHFAIYLSLISIAGKTNDKLRSSLSAYPGSMDTDLKPAIYLRQAQAVVESSVLYINNFDCKPVGITIWGFFIVEQDLVMSLLGTVFSYSVIMYCLK